MLYEILASVTHNPHYLNKYITFITNCQAQNESYSGYTEKHHICPKAADMFPEFTSFSEFPWNCVVLTPRQHFIAHLLLHKCYPQMISQTRALYLMTNSLGIKTKSKLYSNLKLEAIESSKGKVTVRDSEGSILQVELTDSRYLSGDLISINVGKITVKDINGTTFQVDKTDSRYLTGELVGATKGNVTVRDTLGNTFNVDKNDPRFLSGELVSITKGKVTVRDSNGKTFQVDKTDTRYLAGELVSANKGIATNRRTLNPEQVQEIRVAIKDPTSIITDEYIASVIKPSQLNKVGKSPIEELQFRNGNYLTYSKLIASYYAQKFKMRTSSIKKIVDGKTYIDIV